MLCAILALACSGGEHPASTSGDALAALDRALLDRDPLTRAQALSGALLALRAGDMDEATAILERRQYGVSREEVRLFMLAWARFDAPGALAWARSNPTSWSRGLSEAAAFAWGYRDGPAALASVEAIEDDTLRDLLRTEVMDGWIRAPEKAAVVDHIARGEDIRRRRRLTFVLVGEVRTQGLDALERFIEALPGDLPNGFKQNAFYHASVAIARDDPRRAADWYERHAQQGYSVGSLAPVARGWAASGDYDALFRWLRDVPVDEQERRADRDEAIAQAFRMWLHADADAAETWLAASLPDARLDPAIRELVRARSRREPVLAVEWAQRIEDETLRRRALRPALVAWARVDAPAARDWLDANDMPPELRSRVLNEARLPAPPERAQTLPGGS